MAGRLGEEKVLDQLSENYDKAEDAERLIAPRGKPKASVGGTAAAVRALCSIACFRAEAGRCLYGEDEP